MVRNLVRHLRVIKILKLILTGMIVKRLILLAVDMAVPVLANLLVPRLVKKAKRIFRTHGTHKALMPRARA